MKHNSGKKNCELKIPRCVTLDTIPRCITLDTIPRCVTLDTIPLWRNTRTQRGRRVDHDFKEMNKSTPLTKRH
jgi:Zn ribbon nucleic-acid-binding protein